MLSTVKKAIAVAVQTGVPVLVWGKPGTGKTSFFYNLGRILELPTEVVIGSIHEPTDFSGLPVPEDHHIWFAPPDWARRLAEAGKGLLFLDELSTAPPSVQAAMLRVAQERVVGSLALPPEVRVVAAANPPEEAAGGWDLAPPLANRFCHLYWDVEPSGWVEGYLAGFVEDERIPILPGNWREKLPEAKALVAAFIKVRPQLLLSMPEEESERGKAWPSPRTWDMAATLMAACMSIGADVELEGTLLAGAVGEGPAHEFLNWRQHLDLPQPEEALKNPDAVQIPEDDDKIYALTMSVASYATGKGSPKLWYAAWKILAKAARAGRADVAAVAAIHLNQNAPKGVSTPEEIEAFADIIMAARRG